MATATIVEHPFTQRPAMMSAACAFLADGLRRLVSSRGRASLGLSGGSTPRPLYEQLSRERLDWSAVNLALLDDRWVGSDHPASNEAMVRATLLQNEARDAALTALKTPHETPREGMSETAAAIFSTLTPPLDAAILGMGPDGHTLSWFPHAENLSEALNPNPGGLVTWVRALPSTVTGDYLDRATLTLGAVRGAKLLMLLMTGPDKRDAFDAALAAGPVEAMPIRALLRDAGTTLHVFWAP